MKKIFTAGSIFVGNVAMSGEQRRNGKRKKLKTYGS